MKKLFTVMAIFALVLTACPPNDEESNGSNESSGTTLQINNQSSKELNHVVFQSVLFIKENADIIGAWTGTGEGFFGAQQLKLDIADNAWIGSVEPQFGEKSTGQGKWTRNGNALTFNNSAGGYTGPRDDLTDGTATLSGDVLTANFKVKMSPCTFTLTSANLQKTIKSGNSVTKKVEDGSGYIFFKLNAVDYYTNEIVVVEKNGKTIFTFNNNTLVVEAANPGESKILGGL
jgi:hypothetical protein